MTDDKIIPFVVEAPPRAEGVPLMIAFEDQRR
jgi:hypothetical protein